MRIKSVSNSGSSSVGYSLSYSPDNPVGCFLSCLLGRSLSNPLSSFLTYSTGYSLSNPKGNLLSNPQGLSLNYLGGQPLGGTPTWWDILDNYLRKKCLRRNFASIFICLLGIILYNDIRRIK